MSAIDPDCGVNALVNYTLGDVLAKTRFSVKPDTGELCVTSSLDYENTSEYEFPVIATDRGWYILDLYRVLNYNSPRKRT